MDEDRICNQIVEIYLKLYLKYKKTGDGNKTPDGYLVTKEVIQKFSQRLQKYLALR